MSDYTIEKLAGSKQGYHLALNQIHHMQQINSLKTKLNTSNSDVGNSPGREQKLKMSREIENPKMREV
jgi:hypothetical protein